MAYKQILVPVDYSEHSKSAVRLAADIATPLGASLDIVHVWDRPTYVSDAILVGHPGESQRSLASLIEENAQKDMADYLAALSLPSSVQYKSRLLSGEPASTLVHELEKGEHDLVVVGTHGRTGLAHLLLGSVAEKMIRLSPVPVLTVPARGKNP